MLDSMRPFLSLYVVWHPKFSDGHAIAEYIRKHFRRELNENIVEGTGLSVLYRSMAAPNLISPLPIEFSDSESSATIVLIDQEFIADQGWVDYVHYLAKETESLGFKHRLFPVFINKSAMSINVDEQGLRLFEWYGSFEEKMDKLIAQLTYEFCRMLRYYLAYSDAPENDEIALEGYLKKVQIFISHSKHDNNGERIAILIRSYLHENSGLQSFFDVLDIPPGVKFQQVLLHQVRSSAMISLHSDSYSSREWCRKEIIEAKRWNVPLVIANCIENLDERSFPYMGNVPVVRLEPKEIVNIHFVIYRLLDEVLKKFLWDCKVKLIENLDPSLIFIPRYPELISLTYIANAKEHKNITIVYPDPPLSAEEERLFFDIVPHVQLRSFTEWRAGALR